MITLRASLLAAARLLAAIPFAAPGYAAVSEITLQGRIDHSAHTRYLELPFEVPAGTGRISVEFSYPRGNGVTIDLGLLDPQRLRGWSGGNKRSFTLSEVDATPSYLPGPLPAGRWKLLLGVPHADETAAVDFTARIQLASGPDAHSRGFAEQPLRRAPGWYRGDLHSHSGHSDGSCESAVGSRVPCPVQRTLDAARDRGLDFIALTEHNTRSHFHSQRELQAANDDLLLIAGQELTTFYGHANLLGSTGFVDWRLDAADAAPLVAQLARSGGLLVINHPGLPSGKACMGCGWTASIDFSRVTAVEVLNGGTLRATGGLVHSPVSGIPFWEARLAAGERLTAIAGSDNHDPDSSPEQAGSIARPTTVIYAEQLSQAALMDGLRSGRVFVDVNNSGGIVELSGKRGDQTARMGQVLDAGPGDTVELGVTVRNLPEAVLRIWYRDQLLPAISLDHAEDGALAASVDIVSDGQPGWLRVEVESPGGDTLLISNPVYLQPE